MVAPAVITSSMAILRVEIVAQRTGYQEAVKDWPQFGYDAPSSGAYPASTGITAANAASLTRRQVTLDGTVDASAIYLHAVAINGLSHDVFFVTTTYGKTIAIDADSGAVLWEYQPPSFASLAGTAQITNSPRPPIRTGTHLCRGAGWHHSETAIADGHVVWTTSITLLPSREKIASPLKVFNGQVIAVTGGYIGDAPPYQGHVAVLDSQSGSLLEAWNSLCSDQTGCCSPRPASPRGRPSGAAPEP